MAFMDLAEKRYSVRLFTKEQIPDKKLQDILEIARLAPTSQNDQPQRLFVLQSDEAIGKLEQAAGKIVKAPTYILVAYDSRETRDRSYPRLDGGTISATIVSTYLMLGAFDEGLGSIWIGDVDLGVLKNSLGLEEEIVPVGVMAIGFPSVESKPAPAHKKRKPVAKTTRYL